MSSRLRKTNHKRQRHDQPVETQPIGRCFFPLVSRSKPVTVSYGSILIYNTPPSGIGFPETWIDIREVARDTTPHYLFNPALLQGSNGSKAMAIHAAISAVGPPPTNRFVHYVTDNHCDFDGTSCGLAAFVACLFGVTNFIATGYLMEDVHGKEQALVIKPVDHVNTKIAGFLGHASAHLAPAKIFLLPFENLAQVTEKKILNETDILTVSKLIRHGSDAISQGSKFMFCFVETVGDLITIINAMREHSLSQPVKKP
jgi:hypothetical protein